MLACNYHTYTDINKIDWVGGDAFNIPLSNTENIIYDMLNDINTNQLKGTGLKAVFSKDDKNGDLRQSYNIYDIENGYTDDDYREKGNNVGFGFIKLKD
ncbi:MAG: hypothetical protein PHV23_05280 [Candidatus Gracilibacteria bacterium]|nr:hypothetical protein [Candidatus Gracilibacteria bacterium]